MGHFNEIQAAENFSGTHAKKRPCPVYANYGGLMSKGDGARPRSVVMTDELWNSLAVAAAQETVNHGKRVSTAAFIRKTLQDRVEDVLHGITPSFPKVEIMEIGDDGYEVARDDDNDVESGVDNTVPF